jgi:hypothetical protein
MPPWRPRVLRQPLLFLGGGVHASLLPQGAAPAPPLQEGMVHVSSLFLAATAAPAHCAAAASAAPPSLDGAKPSQAAAASAVPPSLDGAKPSQAGAASAAPPSLDGAKPSQAKPIRRAKIASTMMSTESNPIDPHQPTTSLPSVPEPSTADCINQHENQLNTSHQD